MLDVHLFWFKPLSPRKHWRLASSCWWLRRWRECLGCPVLDSCCYCRTEKWSTKMPRLLHVGLWGLANRPHSWEGKKNTPNFDKMPTEPSRILAAHTQTLRRVGKVCDSILTWWQYISEVPRVIWMVTRIKQNKLKEPIALCKPSCGLQISQNFQPFQAYIDKFKPSEDYPISWPTNSLSYVRLYRHMIRHFTKDLVLRYDLVLDLW